MAPPRRDVLGETRQFEMMRDALRRAVDLQGQLTQAQIDLGKANESVEFRYILLDRAESTGTPSRSPRARSSARWSCS